MRYNHAKDVVRGTVEQTGTITLDRNYHERMSSRVDVEMSSCNEAEEDSSMRIDKSAELSELEDLKQKMAIGRKQASVHLNSKSPAAQTVAERSSNQKKHSMSAMPKPIPVQMMSDIQPQSKISFQTQVPQQQIADKPETKKPTGRGSPNGRKSPRRAQETRKSPHSQVAMPLKPKEDLLPYIDMLCDPELEPA